MVGRRRARAATAPDQLAASRTLASTSSIDTTAAIRARGRMPPRSWVRKETSASISASGESSGAAPGAPSASSIFAGLKEGMLADSSDTESASVAGHAHKLADAHDFAIADPAGGGVRGWPGDWH